MVVCFNEDGSVVSPRVTLKSLFRGVIDVATVTVGNTDRWEGRDGQTDGLRASQWVCGAPRRLWMKSGFIEARSHIFKSFRRRKSCFAPSFDLGPNQTTNFIVLSIIHCLLLSKQVQTRRMDTTTSYIYLNKSMVKATR